MKKDNLLKTIKNAGKLTISDENGKKLINISAAELCKILDGSDNTETLYRDILDGHSGKEEIRQRAAALGIKDTGKRGLYLLELENDVTEDTREAATALLGELFITDEDSVIISSGPNDLVLIHSLSSKKEAEQLKENAGKMLSMLNTELMLKLRIAYGSVATDLAGLAGSLREARFAMEVMKLFYEERLVADYASLATGGLINDLSREACLRFLNECFGSKLRSRLGEEELQMVNRFFEKNLNISETARELYLHRNTLGSHLEKLQKKTGLDIRHFDDAMRLKLALMIESRLNQKGEH